MLLSTTQISLNPDKRQEFLQTIGRLLEPIRSAKGCLTFRFYIDAGDENSSLLLGEWETAADLDSYLCSEDSRVLRGAIAVLSSQSTESQSLVTLTR